MTPDSHLSPALWEEHGLPQSRLRLLHLSDIHFTAFDGRSNIDLEHAVRARMLDDIRYLRATIGPMDAILVVGDVAARGKDAEYQVAASFLEEVCAAVGVSPARVACVPGNHDIDRSALGPLHAAVRHQLRGIDPLAISDTLQAIVLDDLGSTVLFRPLASYNTFALRYGCDISQEKLLWAPKILPFGQRELRISGITSAWICDQQDSDKRDSDRIVAGLFQVASAGEGPNAISLILCHHPLHWLRDGELIRPWLARAHVVLTGHEHAAGIEVSEDGRSVVVASGAVNPSRTDAGWIPAYNVIEITEAPANGVTVTIHTRIWQAKRTGRAEFGPADERPYSLSLELAGGSSPMPTPPDQATAGPRVEPTPPEPMQSQDRELLYAIMASPPDRRRSVARRLDLLSDAVMGLEADRELLSRALASGRLTELKEQIENR